MKTFVAVLLVCACFCPVYGQANQSASGDVEAVKQLERDWIDAVKAGDVDKLSRIIADDWSGSGPDGTFTKKKAMSDLKTGLTKVESIEVGPMDVKMLGSVAVVQGSDTEKSSYKGKDTSGKWTWTDVFVKRDGKWLAVRSQSTRMK